jgi:RNA polymerase primary sigma factor
MNSNPALEIPVLGNPSSPKPAARPRTRDKCSPHSPCDRGRRYSRFERPSRPPRPSRAASADSPRGGSPLSATEERELAERIKRGDTIAHKQLILANLRLVVSIVRRYRSSKLSFDDLVQEGNLGLIRASQDFDPSLHDTRFSTYAELWIRAFVHRALIANDSLVRVPEHIFLLRKRYRRAISALGGPDQNAAARTEPSSIEQLAQEMGVSARQLEPARQIRIECETRGGTDEDGEAMAITEVMVDCHRPDEEAANHEERLLLEAALKRLNPVEAWVIRERYGLSTLIPGEDDWAAPNPSGEAECTWGAQPDEPGTNRTYFHRTYPELERDCGLSRHRIHQVERIALDNLRDVLGPWLFRSV